MFPYVEFSLRGVDPVGLYDVIFDIIPASNKCFKFLNNKWVPIGKKEHEFKKKQIFPLLTTSARLSINHLLIQAYIYINIITTINLTMY